jgi:3-oxoacyl-[acyl-carrier-protein] synthase II
LFDTSRQRVKTAAEVDLPSDLPSTHLTRREAQKLTRAGRLLLLAAEQACRQAEWRGADDVPIVLGTTSGAMSAGEAYYRQAVTQPNLRRQQLTRVVQYQAQRQGLELARAFGFRGAITIIANACASGANAIGHAASMIRAGQAERVLTGGYDALCQLVFAGFDSLQALSPTRCRPFDSDRDGLALGEGAAILTLETLQQAHGRGAAILGEIAGYGASTDPHHLTQPHPQGNAALASMKKACEQAGVVPEQIGYVNAHGTGTPLNDNAEAAAINDWAGSHALNLHVSSTKGSIGHLLGAAGAVETIICLMALREGWLPPTANLATPDPVCRFPIVRQPHENVSPLEYALTNSFGFGGANATLVLRRWE